ncbi:hypothetical protein BDY24DRAFT_404265 [Mrakia frigida]|uniref:zinc finger MYND domain-containing protein n=1 Tax=Mrakia frigida TaxID=29902 RepID=UPI003FCC13AC
MQYHGPASTLKPDPEELAKLFGISDEDPKDFIVFANGHSSLEPMGCPSWMQRVNAILQMVFDADERVKAQFTARYLVRLVETLPLVPQVGNYFNLVISWLQAIQDLGLYENAFLRRSPAAKDVLLHLAQSFAAQHDEPFVQYDGNTKARIHVLYDHLLVMDNIMHNAKKHATASTVNLALPPPVVLAFSRNAEAYLSHPLIKNLPLPPYTGYTVTSERENFKRFLAIVTVNLNRFVDKSTWSKESLLDCQHNYEANLTSENNATRCVPKGREELLQFCSKCKSACYCSPAHQKEDWKNHKKVCVAPRW